MSDNLDRVVVRIAVTLDLERYAHDYGLVGVRSARDDLKQTILDIVRMQLERMGIPRDAVVKD